MGLRKRESRLTHYFPVFETELVGIDGVENGGKDEL